MRGYPAGALVVFIMIFCGCATTPDERRSSTQLPAPPEIPPELPAVGSPCTGSGFTYGDGPQVHMFSGVVLGRVDARTMRPVSGAEFISMERVPPRLSFSTDEKGQFQGQVVLDWHNWKRCRDGVVEGGFSVDIAKVTVRAQGCADALVQFASERPVLNIELDCQVK